MSILFFANADEALATEPLLNNFRKVVQPQEKLQSPLPDTDFYACKFERVYSVNELIKQFHINLDGNFLTEIYLHKLANRLGVNIVEKKAYF